HFAILRRAVINTQTYAPRQRAGCCTAVVPSSLLHKTRFSIAAARRDENIAAATRLASQHRRAHVIVVIIVATFIAGEPKVADVYALFDAEIGQQLQGQACTCPAGRALSSRGGGHPQGREPHARVSGQKSERPSPASRSRTRPLRRRIECDPVASRQRNAAAPREPL